MAKLSIVRLSQYKNKYGSFAYRIVAGEAEEGTNLYGDDGDIIYSSQKIGVWNQPVEVEHYLRTSKTGKSYSGFSIDQELNSFQQRGHTATLAVRAGLDADKIAMLKMIAELDEQELRVTLIQTKMRAISPPVGPSANPSVKQVNGASIEDAEIVSSEEDIKAEMMAG